MTTSELIRSAQEHENNATEYSKVREWGSYSAHMLKAANRYRDAGMDRKAEEIDAYRASCPAR